MSSFVVSHNTITRILSALHRTDIASPDGTPFCVMNYDDLEALGREMLYFNACATGSRYRQKPTENLPETTGEKYDEFKLDLKNVSMTEGYKALNCFTYQCAEGTWADSSFYKAWERIEARMAYRIIAATPEYESAAWDVERTKEVVE